MNPAQSYWQPIIAREWNLKNWTYGVPVREITDLYSPSIFGATQNLRCECGKLSGVAAVGEFCTQCNVFVTDDIAYDHRTRIGRMELAVPLQHPLGTEASIIQAFPIAPIAYRQTSSGILTPIGKKYETLVRANLVASECLGPRFRGDYFEKWKAFDKGPLLDAIRSVIGIDTNGEPTEIINGQNDSLLALMVVALSKLQPDMSTLIRCCGIVLKFQTAV